MTITAHTYLARDLIDLGEFHDDMIGLSIVDGRAPVLVVSYPGASAEFPIGCDLAAGLISAVNRCDLLELKDRMDTLPGLSGERPDTLPGLSRPRPDLAPESVRGLVTAALA